MGVFVEILIVQLKKVKMLTPCIIILYISLHEEI